MDNSIGGYMPKVGSKAFKYTAAGKKAAKKYAKKTGKKITKAKPKKRGKNGKIKTKKLSIY